MHLHLIWFPPKSTSITFAPEVTVALQAVAKKEKAAVLRSAATFDNELKRRWKRIVGSLDVPVEPVPTTPAFPDLGDRFADVVRSASKRHGEMTSTLQHILEQNIQELHTEYTPQFQEVDRVLNDAAVHAGDISNSVNQKLSVLQKAAEQEKVRFDFVAVLFSNFQ